MRNRFYWIDAFADRPFSGNPCAVVLAASEFPDETMQAVAREMNLSETAFVFSSKKADFKARYFTPEREIPLAGHPTLAVIQALIEDGAVALRAKEVHKVTLELKAGIIEVEIHPGSEQPLISMRQLSPQFLRKYDASAVLPLFGLDPDDAIHGLPIQTVSTGTPMLMVPLKSHEALRCVKMNADAYRAFREAGDFFSPHLFCITGATDSGQTFARHLGTPPDTLEDPFTGSATGCMGAYLWSYGLIKTPTFTAEQGHWMGRPGQARVEVIGTHDAIEAVKVGGTAVPVIKGEIEINP